MTLQVHLTNRNEGIPENFQDSQLIPAFVQSTALKVKIHAG